MRLVIVKIKFKLNLIVSYCANEISMVVVARTIWSYAPGDFLAFDMANGLSAIASSAVRKHVPFEPVFADFGDVKFEMNRLSSPPTFLKGLMAFPQVTYF